MQSTNIYKVEPILCFRSKNVRTGCKRQGQRMGRRGVGWQHACAMQTNMVPLNFFSIVAPMVGGANDSALHAIGPLYSSCGKRIFL